MEERLETDASAQCPYCGEWVEPELDPLGPSEEQYIEDCPVCCRPWVVHVQRTESGLESWLSREDD